MIKIDNHIILDQIDSWPDEILTLIENSEQSLKNYLREEKRIDKLGRTDLKIRYNRPQNIYTQKWDKVNYDIETYLQKHSIIGIHCTKLMEYEIKNILKNGLKPLSKELANKRIKTLYKKGLISTELKNKIYDKAEFSDENRNGKIFTFHCLSTLKDEWGLNKLLGLWGGESIYSYLNTSEELKKIGTSCIVITSIKISELDIYPQLSKRMLCIYFDDNYCPHDTDSIFENKLKVLKVITREDKLFNNLTNIEKWREEI